MINKNISQKRTDGNCTVGKTVAFGRGCGTVGRVVASNTIGRTLNPAKNNLMKNDNYLFKRRK